MGSVDEELVMAMLYSDEFDDDDDDVDYSGTSDRYAGFWPTQPFPDDDNDGDDFVTGGDIPDEWTGDWSWATMLNQIQEEEDIDEWGIEPYDDGE